VQSIGLAFLFVPINTMAFYYISRERLSYATGIMNLARNIGGSCGIAFTMTMLARRAQYHQSVLAAHVTSLDSGIAGQLQGMTQVLHQQGFSLADAAVRAQAMLYGLVQQQAGILAFMDTFWVLAMVFVGLMPFMLLMRGTGRR